MVGGWKEYFKFWGQISLSQPLMMHKPITHWNMLIPLSAQNPTFLCQSHYQKFNPTLCQPIPLFLVYIYYPTITLLVYTHWQVPQPAAKTHREPGCAWVTLTISSATDVAHFSHRTWSKTTAAHENTKAISPIVESSAGVVMCRLCAGSFSKYFRYRNARMTWW